MLGDCDRSQSVHRAPTGNDDWKNGRRGRYALAVLVDNYAAWVLLLAEPLRHGIRDRCGPWIVAVDYQRLQRDGFGKCRTHGRFVELWARGECEPVEFAHLLGSSYRVYTHQWTSLAACAATDLELRF